MALPAELPKDALSKIEGLIVPWTLQHLFFVSHHLSLFCFREVRAAEVG